MFKELLCFGALLALTQATALRVQARDGTRNVYYGYSRSKRTYGAQLTNAASITAAFDLAEPIIVIVHGQGGLIHDMLKTNILESTLSNVVVVDWTGYSNRGYHQAATAVPSIGYDGLADFLSLVVTAGWALHDIHLIGFDLGAHVCGFAGRERGGGIGKITGLNPAGQDWGPGSGHLSKGDALYVEVIHTEIRTYGIGIPIGDIDYFINNGITQPGCTNTLCSHNRAYEIMAASVSNDIKGNMCNDLSEMQRNVCRSHERTVGTLEIWRRGTGIYRANTSNRFPYGQ